MKMVFHGEFHTIQTLLETASKINGRSLREVIFLGRRPLRWIDRFSNNLSVCQKPDGVYQKLFDMTRITQPGWIPKASLRERIRKATSDFVQREMHITL